MKITTGFRSDIDEALGDALRGYADAVGTLYRGESGAYADCWGSGDADTLYGAWGPVDKGRTAIEDTLRWVASRCSGGTAGEVTLTEIGQSGNLAYSVGFERVTLSVDGRPPRVMMLRVTQVYRRRAKEWAIVHRHADELPDDQRRQDNASISAVDAPTVAPPTD
jgi:ketosteroid isomerase-like protein